jgi:hypothetical protein
LDGERPEGLWSCTRNAILSQLISKWIKAATNQAGCARDNDRVCLVVPSARFAYAELQFDCLILYVAETKLRSYAWRKQSDSEEHAFHPVFDTCLVPTTADEKMPTN